MVVGAAEKRAGSAFRGVVGKMGRRRDQAAGVTTGADATVVRGRVVGEARKGVAEGGRKGWEGELGAGARLAWRVKWEMGSELKTEDGKNNKIKMSRGG
jgi:hypothetical protein